jgi:2-methylcitrate dehydratase PrpD
VLDGDDMSAQLAPNADIGAVPQSAQAISRTIADFAQNLRCDDLSPRLRDFARYHILDVVGASLAATRFEFSHRALSGLTALADGGSNVVLGMAAKLPLKDAVLMNGILAHGLDYDDTHPAGPVHPSSSAFPCALGLAEFLDRTDQELLTSYLIGVEITTRFGMAANGTMHKSGFHTTGVAGHLCCAVAAGHLFHLSAEQLVWAQGLAGSTASAIAEHRADGAWNKRMHSGWAGVGGITAVSLARSGFIGTRKVYEGGDGLLRSHAGAYVADVKTDALTEGLGVAWRAEEVAVKPFPVCHILHACVDSALALRRAHDLKARDIAQVRALLHPETFHFVCDFPDMRRRPASDYIAKFSVYYAVAAALVRGKLGFAELEPEALNDPEILAFAERVNYDADPESQFPKYFSGGVVIILKDGRVLTHVEKINRGAGDRALTGEEIAAKFMENAELAVSRSRAAEIRDRVLDIERHSARDLARALGAL